MSYAGIRGGRVGRAAGGREGWEGEREGWWEEEWGEEGWRRGGDGEETYSHEFRMSHAAFA